MTARYCGNSDCVPIACLECDARRPRLAKPYHDCPACPRCAVRCGVGLGPNMSGNLPPGELRCCACGHRWQGTAAELEQAAKADAAYRDAIARGEL